MKSSKLNISEFIKHLTEIENQVESKLTLSKFRSNQVVNNFKNYNWLFDYTFKKFKVEIRILDQK